MEILETEIGFAWACLAIVIVYIIADICKIGEDEWDAYNKAKRRKK